jgi:hypothetical protein
MTTDIRIHKKYFKISKDNKNTEREEEVIFGPRGIKFKLYTRDDDDRKKVIGKQDSEGKYKIIHIHNADKKAEENLSIDDVINFLKKEKSLDFVLKFMEDEDSGKKSKKSKK